eukprot:TRINITY_DN2607_c0_g1_i1.p1 TRINITY_DN2607_c0_g1~~TRINITY_DN2607_c0_g1_i1.p1  ORF type:complete len:763 (-),score=98.41 TRINITY_DN2607_c0_g1_i1:47-2335(-)
MSFTTSCTFAPEISSYAKRKQHHRPLETRIEQVLEDRSHKLRQLSQALEANILKQMTFKPEINPASAARVSAVSKGPQPHQDSQFVGHVASEYEHRPTPRSPQREATEPTFAPYITSKAKALTSDEPVYERLYKPRPRAGSGTAETATSAAPPASARGRPVRAEGNSAPRARSAGSSTGRPPEEATEHLYRDAFDRKERQELSVRLAQAKAESERNSRKLSQTSEFLVRRRREKELKEIWLSFCAAKNKYDPETRDLPAEEQRMNYTQLRLLLREIGFFESLPAVTAAEREDEETKVTDKIWAAMNIDGLPFIQYRDFARVIGALLEPSRGRNGHTEQSENSDSAQEDEEYEEELSDEEEQYGVMEQSYTPPKPTSVPVVASPELDRGSRTNHPHHRIPAKTTPKPAKVTSASQPNFRQDLNFHKLYVNGIHHGKRNTSSSGSAKIRVSGETCTFQPTINPTSRKLEEESNGEYLMESGKRAPRYQALMEKERKRQERIIREREAKEKEELEGCTFRPHINRYRPAFGGNEGDDEVGLPPEERREQKFKELHNGKPTRDVDPSLHITTEEREVQEFCTFKPKLGDSQKTLELLRRAPARTDVGIAGFEEYMKRIRQAQKEKQEREKLEENLKMGRPAFADAKPWYKDSTADAKQTTPRPFNFHLDKRQRAKPLLYMDINLGPGRTGRLGIHQNDSPRTLARNFSSSYQLDEGLRRKLELLLRQHMEELIPGFKERYQREREEEERSAAALAGHGGSPDTHSG